ncbi:MAG: HEAT repeat domain-containing protein [Planctomycetota bacterium]|nr:HEAT repeat domain-containing protein [Planctomycetota bacterium]
MKQAARVLAIVLALAGPAACAARAEAAPAPAPRAASSRARAAPPARVVSPVSVTSPVDAAAPGGAPDAAAVDEALGQLNSPDWILQARSIAVLARAKAPQALAPLKAILAGQGRPYVRGRALVALAEIRGAGALDDALALAAGGSPELREAAVEALGICGSPGALAAVEARLSDPIASVRNQALVALARLQKQKAWDRVAPLLGDGDPATVIHAARALVYVDSADARPALVGLLGHAEAAVRIAAAEAERQVRDPEAAPVLLRRATSDSSTDVRWAAERALLAYDPQALVKPCLAAMGDKELSVHATAVRVLAARPSDEARAGLADLLRDAPDKHHTIASQVLDVLGGADPSPYQDVIVRYLDSRETPVRRKAVSLLARCPQADHWGLLKPLLADSSGAHVSAAAFKALRSAAQGSPPGGIVDYLVEVLQGGSAEAVEEALALLAERLTATELPKAVSVLEPFLAGADESRRRMAVAALERLAEGDAARSVAAAQGYLVQWRVLGPFPNDIRERGFTAAYPPEFGVDFTRPCEAFPFGRGAAVKMVTAAAGNGPGQALSIRPPEEDGAAGVTAVSYTLDLPKATNIKLTLRWGIRQDAPEGAAARFEVAVNGRKAIERQVAAADGWVPAEVDLSPFAGQRAVVDLAVDGLGKAAGDWALVSEPRIVADGAAAADLVALAPAAVARIVMPGVAAAQLAWQPARGIRPSGEVDLRQAISPAEDLQVAYAAADVHWHEDQKVHLVLAADGPVKLWVNGVKVAERGTADDRTVQCVVEFKKGANRLLVKECSEADRWSFSLRLTDDQGRRLAPAKAAP